MPTSVMQIFSIRDPSLQIRYKKNFPNALSDAIRSSDSELSVDQSDSDRMIHPMNRMNFSGTIC